ncbi:arsenate reductase ArsC [Kordiimonas aquimaris]|uniref:arsenate reductase ArsC n=1 Tax=Kordiimonas aquimaris TaxID=707591 RepID=UPI0021D02DD8|nr:arsenate reductase ArsC [Kordiimonas aquimaris]
MNILVLCTGNSARSILGEALFNATGCGRIKAFSAGSNPNGTVNPYALRLLKDKGFDTSVFRSKSWDEFAANGAPEMDIVITVCGNAASETCPVWIGAPITVHWGFPDPAAVEGSDEEIMAAFKETFYGLKRNVAAFVAIDFDAMAPEDISLALADIHKGQQ